MAAGLPPSAAPLRVGLDMSLGDYLVMAVRGDQHFFVVTHAAPSRIRLGLSFTFVLDGLASAIAQAKEAAGARDVVVMGGAEVVRSSLDHRHLDGLRLHIAPVVLGAGTPLFPAAKRRELVQKDVRVSQHAVHVTCTV